MVHDFAGDPCTAPWHATGAAWGFRSVAALPIRFQGEVCAALTVYDSDPNVFQDKETALLEEVAAAVSFALENLERDAQRKQVEEKVLASEARLEAQEIACLGSYIHDIHKTAGPVPRCSTGFSTFPRTTRGPLKHGAISSARKTPGDVGLFPRRGLWKARAF